MQETLQTIREYNNHYWYIFSMLNIIPLAWIMIYKLYKPVNWDACKTSENTIPTTKLDRFN
jgi:hypothetical protein